VTHTHTHNLLILGFFPFKLGVVVLLSVYNIHCICTAIARKMLSSHTNTWWGDFDKKLEPIFSLSLSLSLFLLGGGAIQWGFGIMNMWLMIIHLKAFLVLLPPSDDQWYHFTSSSSHLDSWVRKKWSPTLHTTSNKTLASLLASLLPSLPLFEC